MKKRIFYSILFGVPGLILSVIVATVAVGVLTGFFWLFVLGDNAWPKSIENGLSIFAVVVFLASWAATIVIGFVVGKRLERDPSLNKTHIWISLGLVVTSVLCIVLYQVRVGNLGPQSEGAQCMDYCSQRGYPASSVSPQDANERTCGCFDTTGHEIVTVPIESIDPVK